MLGKLLALIVQAKGATVAAVLIAGAATATVATTTPEVQDAIQQFTANVGLSSSQRDCGDGQGQPVVVAQRNAADKLLRDAYNKDHKGLENLRGGGKDVDNKAVGDIVKKYDDQMRDTLNNALNDVAAVTLGRDGQIRKAEAAVAGSSGAKPSKSAEGSESPKPSCSPAPAAAGSAAPNPSASPKPSESPRAAGSSKPEDQGRVAVANRTTLDTAMQSIVVKATNDMDDLLTKASVEASNVPALDHANPGNKPEDKGGKPGDNPGQGNKPGASPKQP